MSKKFQEATKHNLITVDWHKIFDILQTYIETLVSPSSSFSIVFCKRSQISTCLLPRFSHENEDNRCSRAVSCCCGHQHESAESSTNRQTSKDKESCVAVSLHPL
ncbi:unnamed protein product [Larinioides sclopetarius]|uniref:Uncharacterized protein n=1 Tax=Larinioides sclopetarius TaxID=280406 RepID=A0AAV2BQ87_9ARAC